MNIKACCHLFSWIKWLNNADLNSLSTVIKRCAILGTVTFSGAIDISTASVTAVLAKKRTCFDKVAENNRF